MNRHRDRRHFLRTGAAAALGASLLPTAAAATRRQEEAPLDPALARAGETLLARDAKGRPVFPDGFGVGGTQIGNIFFATSDEDAYAMLQAAWDAGVRYFDTSPWYGLGLSERRLGNFLDDKDPATYVVSTKIGRLLRPDPNAGEIGIWAGEARFHHEYDYTAEGTRRSIEDSLQRLGLPKIDVVLVHDLAPSNAEDLGGYGKRMATALDGAMPELSRLRDEGVIGAWGMGVNDIEPSLTALGNADPDVILQACQYSLVDHADAVERLLPKCREQNVGIIVGAPLNAGFLAGVERWHYGDSMPTRFVEKRERLRALSKEHDVDLRTAALQFAAAPDEVVAIIPGARNAEQARANRESLDASIPAEYWDALRSEGLVHASAAVPNTAG